MNKLHYLYIVLAGPILGAMFLMSTGCNVTLPKIELLQKPVKPVTQTTTTTSTTSTTQSAASICTCPSGKSIYYSGVRDTQGSS